jgi:hypothetical protein
MLIPKSGRVKVSANFAVAALVGLVKPKVATGKWMAPLAVGFAIVDRGDRKSALVVHVRGYWFKVKWIAAISPSAQMVNLHSGRNCPNEYLVG